MVTSNSSKSSKEPLRKSVHWIDGDPFVVDSSSADGDVEAKEVFDGGKIERRYTFSKAPGPGRMAYVNCGIIIGRYHSHVALLLLDSDHLSTRQGKHRRLRGIEQMGVLTSHSVPMPNSGRLGSSSHTSYCPWCYPLPSELPACNHWLQLSPGAPRPVLLSSPWSYRIEERVENRCGRDGGSNVLVTEEPEIAAHPFPLYSIMVAITEATWTGLCESARARARVSGCSNVLGEDEWKEAGWVCSPGRGGGVPHHPRSPSSLAKSGSPGRASDWAGGRFLSTFEAKTTKMCPGLTPHQV